MTDLEYEARAAAEKHHVYEDVGAGSPLDIFVAGYIAGTSRPTGETHDEDDEKALASVLTAWTGPWLDRKPSLLELILDAGFTRHPQPTEGQPSDAECVRIANMVQEITGRSIWPSTVKAILRVVADQEGEGR